MARKSFMLVSLKGKTAKEVAKVISSAKGKKILDYMSDKESVTETEVAEKLNMPLSTVHYNMQQLVKAKLVKADEYHYSKRGKEILHYRLVNKYIVIAPEADKSSFFEHIKKYIPVAIIAAGISVIYKFIRYLIPSKVMSTTSTLSDKTVNIPSSAAAPGQAHMEFASEGVNTLANATTHTVHTAIKSSYHFGFPEYFLIGAFSIIIILIIMEYILWRRKK